MLLGCSDGAGHVCPSGWAIKVRVEVDVAEHHVTIVECRPPWRRGMHEEFGLGSRARLRYAKSTRLWSLYWRDRSVRFHEYDRVPAAMSVEDLLAEDRAGLDGDLLGLTSPTTLAAPTVTRWPT